MVRWDEDMIEAARKLREEGKNVDFIAERVGVHPETFLAFRRRTGFQIKPILRSGNRLVGRAEHG